MSTSLRLTNPFAQFLGALLLVGLPTVAWSQRIPCDLVPTNGAPLTVRCRTTGHVLIFVSTGDVTMGGDQGDEDEKPIHTATVSGFFLGKYPVSNLEYEAAGGARGRPGYSQGDDHPATRLSWNDANGFIQWIGAQEARVGDFYVLPTEAMWERAAQGGLNAPKYPWGASLDPSYTLYSSASAVKVADGTPNPWGFFHMTGSVFGWCSDWYDKEYYKSAPAQDPGGPAEGKQRSLRGGTWYIYDKSLRCADRWQTGPDTRSQYVGVRVARQYKDPCTVDGINCGCGSDCRCTQKCHVRMAVPPPPPPP